MDDAIFIEPERRFPIDRFALRRSLDLPMALAGYTAILAGAGLLFWLTWVFAWTLASEDTPAAMDVAAFVSIYLSVVVAMNIVAMKMPSDLD